MLNKNYIPYIIMLILFLGLCFCGFMWSRTSHKLDSKTAELVNANATIMALQIDNDKLNEYNNKKNQEIKEVEEKYKEILNNVPSDLCGDVKPSQQLLNYFRKNK
jgi:FtsZ-binding cell division protein ZapB